MLCRFSGRAISKAAACELERSLNDAVRQGYRSQDLARTLSLHGYRLTELQLRHCFLLIPREIAKDIRFLPSIHQIGSWNCGVDGSNLPGDDHDLALVELVRLSIIRFVGLGQILGGDSNSGAFALGALSVHCLSQTRTAE